MVALVAALAVVVTSVAVGLVENTRGDDPGAVSASTPSTASAPTTGSTAPLPTPPLDRDERRRAGDAGSGGANGLSAAEAARARRAAERAAGAGADVGPASEPNIVVVVMDDVSMDLVPTMANLAALSRQGATYDRSYVVNSLCCPSRAAMLTGQPPHLAGVLTNTSGGPYGAQGGYPAFAANDGPQRSYNVRLQRAGYQTAFVGKYLNEYEPGNPTGTVDGPRTPPPVVPGWDDFESVSGGGYNGWRFYRTTSPTRQGGDLGLVSHPRPDPAASEKVKDRSYVGSVIERRAAALATRYERSGQPYLLHVAPYAAHARTGPVWGGADDPVFPAAFRDRPGPGHPRGECGPQDCLDLSATDLPGYGTGAAGTAPTYLDADGGTRPAPAWRTDPVTLTEEAATTRLRDRSRMVQSVDRMLGRLMSIVGPDTYVVVTSDNGFHLGQLGLNGGKGTPYAVDTRVPLVVAGPGVEPGRRPQMVSSLDLASTFEDLAGLRPASFRTGRSLVPTFAAPRTPGSEFTYAEHRQGPLLPGEPDADIGSGGRLDGIPSYTAVRSARGLLVRVDLDRAWTTRDYAWELYRGSTEVEGRNVFAQAHDEPWAQDLRRRLLAWHDCQPRECRALTG